jgi:hypothetical protein
MGGQMFGVSPAAGKKPPVDPAPINRLPKLAEYRWRGWAAHCAYEHKRIGEYHHGIGLVQLKGIDRQ